MSLMHFPSRASSPLWMQAHDYILNKTGSAPDLEPLVKDLSFEKQCELAQVLHNLLLVAFCAEHTSRIKRTFEVLEPLYQNPGITQVFIQTPPSEFRWRSWIDQVDQRKKTGRLISPLFEPGVTAFLLTYAHCFPEKLKGTLNAMAEEDGKPLQWGRHFGMPTKALSYWDLKMEPSKLARLQQRMHDWDLRVCHNVLLDEALDNAQLVTRTRKM